METTEEKTRIYKSLSIGWMGKTMSKTNGITWEICTRKQHTGVVATVAQECKVGNSGGMEMISFSPFTDHSVTLIKEAVKCTENAVRAQHAKALILFDQKAEAGELPRIEESETLKVGQIIWMNGYGQDKYNHKRQAVYEINGDIIKTVNLDTFVFQQHSHVIHDSKLFGIGTYWTTGDVADPIEIGEAIKESKRLIPIREEAAKLAVIEKQRENDKARAALIEQYPYLIPIGEKYTTTSKHHVMDNIRAMLKNNFPGIKFSVVNPHHGTVNIGWSDGPTSKEVSNVEMLFQDSGSDETGDYWDYEGGVFNDTFGGMRFVFCNRGQSQETRNAIQTSGEALYKINPFGCHCIDNFTHMIFSACSLPAGAKVTGIKEKEENEKGNSYTPASFFTLSYDVAAVEAVIPINTGEKTVTHNEEKNGIEITFPGRPNQEVLTLLKSNGWKWSHYNRVWYNRFSEVNLTFANKL